MSGEVPCRDPLRINNRNRSGRVTHVCGIHKEDVIRVKLPQGTGHALRFRSRKKYPDAGKMLAFNLPCCLHPEPVNCGVLITYTHDGNPLGCTQSLPQEPVKCKG